MKVFPDDMVVGTGYRRIDSKATCVLTRFRVTSIWELIKFYQAYRRVRRGSQSTRGLLKTLFLVEDSRTCYTLSLWQDQGAILRFNTNCREHIVAANRAFRGLRWNSTGPELWSAQFLLWAVSPHNLRWSEMDPSLSNATLNEPGSNAGTKE